MKKAVWLAISILYFALPAIVAGNHYTKAIDLALLALGSIPPAVISILLLYDWLTGRRQSNARTLLRKWRRWMTDDESVARDNPQPDRGAI